MADGPRVGLIMGSDSDWPTMEAAAEAIIGLDAFALHNLRDAIDLRVSTLSVTGGDGVAGMITTASTTDRVFSPFEVACLDIQGKVLGRPVSDLLGGRVRDAAPFSAYLFYKYAGGGGEGVAGRGRCGIVDEPVAPATGIWRKKPIEM